MIYLRRTSALSALLALALTLSLSTSASAAVTVDSMKTVTAVQYNVIAHQLMVRTSSGIQFYQNGGGGGCGSNIPNATTDDIKNWASLAQSALLSGKKIDMTYDTCNGVSWILVITIYP